MNKVEFLRELENGLEGKLPDPEINEILSDYRDVFDNGTAKGRAEDEISKEIGSPGKIVRNILEDTANDGRAAAGSFYKEGRDYTDFQKNLNEKTSKIIDKIVTPDSNVKISQLTSMSRRLGAYIIDSLLLGVLVGGLFIILIGIIGFSRYNISDSMYMDPRHAMYYGASELFNGLGIFAFSNIAVVIMFLGISNAFTAIIMWASNGYTPGKWLLSMRVVKLNGSKISFIDALLRDVVIKVVSNSLFSGFINPGSFIWACVTDDHKTLHDLVAQTRVINVDRRRSSSKNPLES